MQCRPVTRQPLQIKYYFYNLELPQVRSQYHRLNPNKTSLLSLPTQNLQPIARISIAHFISKLTESPQLIVNPIEFAQRSARSPQSFGNKTLPSPTNSFANLAVYKITTRPSRPEFRGVDRQIALSNLSS